MRSFVRYHRFQDEVIVFNVLILLATSDRGTSYGGGGGGRRRRRVVVHPFQKTSTHNTCKSSASVANISFSSLNIMHIRSSMLKPLLLVFFLFF